MGCRGGWIFVCLLRPAGEFIFRPFSSPVGVRFWHPPPARSGARLGPSLRPPGRPLPPYAPKRCKNECFLMVLKGALGGQLPGGIVLPGLPGNLSLPGGRGASYRATGEPWRAATGGFTLPGAQASYRAKLVCRGAGAQSATGLPGTVRLSGYRGLFAYPATGGNSEPGPLELA